MKIVTIIFLVIVQSVSPDCPNLINFARELGIQSKQPSIWTQLQGDCCTVSSIVCASNRVIRINWNAIGLNGTINGTAIPSSVTHLLIFDNQISGTIPSVLPSGLITLNIYGNKLSGDIPILPSTLQYIFLGASGSPGNHFTGTIRVYAPLNLYINDNWITDVVIVDSSPLNACDLSNNPLLGNPNIAALTGCAKNDIYSPDLLPNTRSTFFTTTTLMKTTVMPFITTMSIPTTTLTFVFTTNIPSSISIFTALAVVSMTSSTSLQILTTEMPLMTTTTISTTTNTSVTTAVQLLFTKFTITLTILLRCIFSTILLTFVISKTPFLRELKTWMKKEKKKETATNSSIFI